MNGEKKLHARCEVGLRETKKIEKRRERERDAIKVEFTRDVGVKFGQKNSVAVCLLLRYLYSR